MNKKDAEQITATYINPVYGFALKRCAGIQDAEDLAQEIIIRIYRALLAKDDISHTEKFVWTVAHNALANYYRGKQQGGFGIPIEDVAEFLASDFDVSSNIIKNEAASRLHSEIAYLSKLQRSIIIAYYYQNQKQNEIAERLGIPLGTVKWHLFEAKKDLRKGMESMRTADELKFNPVKFEMMGFSGSVGSLGGTGNFFRNRLTQNIAYCTWREGMTVNQIAQNLGVSPVYIESEAEFLEENGFLIKQGDKYLANILIDETTTQLNKLQSQMYQKAAGLFAGELYDSLISSGILNSRGLYYPDYDINFALWALIPYISAISGESLMDNEISFDEAATIRPDGGVNIPIASVLNADVEPPLYFESMKKWCGPCWNGLSDKFIIWMSDSQWSDARVDDNYQNTVKRDLFLLDSFFKDGYLSQDEYAYLAQRGYIAKKADAPATLQVVWIKDTETKRLLLEIGDRIKKKNKAEFEALKAPFIKEILQNTPAQLLKMQKFVLQYIFYSDGWFLLHCLKALTNSGKLKQPNKAQKRSLSTIIVPNN